MRNFIVFVLHFAVLLTGCKNKSSVSRKEFDTIYRPYISAYSVGMINRHEPVIVKFTRPVVSFAEVNKPLKGELFSFSQDLKGITKWTDEQTICFAPEGYWPCGREIKVELNLRNFFDTISAEHKIFAFDIQVPPQSLFLNVEELTPVYASSMQWYSVGGEIKTSQFENPDNLKKSLRIEGYNGEIRWGKFANNYQPFFLDSIERKKDDYAIKFHLNGAPISVDKKETKEIKVPSLGDFRILDIEIKDEPETHIEIEFSDPLEPKQALEAFIKTSNNTFKYVIDGNVIKLFLQKETSGNLLLEVLPGIKNSMEYKLAEGRKITLTIDPPSPRLKASLGEGVIVPRTENIPFSFQSVALKAVDVRITRIYENNILQFLQSHDINESYQLQYVGKVVYERKISLERKGINLLQMNTHSFDLSKLIAAEPGAIYNIQVRCRKDYAIWDCSEDESTSASKEEQYDILLDKPGLWDYYDNYYWYEENPTPCDHYYYRNEYISKNILASDLGITSKHSYDGNVFTAIADLKSTRPLESVKISYYDEQKQLLGTAITDAEGMSFSNLTERPVFLVAQRGNQKGYLKYDSDRLSYSRFETDGRSVRKGVKGFIYAERGVWRPGDSMYVNFILDDSKRLLPPDYPLVFELRDPMGRIVQKILRRKAVNGFYSFPCATDASAPTGDYAATVSVGGIVFDKTFHVETVVPNRLKLYLDFADSLLSPMDKSIGTFTSKWLHGAEASGLDMKLEVSLNALANPFGKKWEQFTFLDPLYEKYSAQQELFDGKLSEEGKLLIPNKLSNSSFKPGIMKAIFYGKVTEPGGGFSTDYFTARYSPYKHYLGIHTPVGEGEYDVLLTSKEHKIEFVCLTESGTPAGDQELELELYRLEYRYWWDYYDNLGSYNGRYIQAPVKKEKMKLVNGKLDWKVSFKEDEYGYYLVRAKYPGGHTCGKTIYVDYPGWYTRYPHDAEGTPVLSVRSDKPSYKVGEKMKLEIPDALNGNYLVTVERGDKILKAEWVNGIGKNLQHTLNVTSDMAPNFYVYVSSVQPYFSKVADKPLRRYAVLSLKVDDPKAHLNPVISSADDWKPDANVSVSISEKSGKAMTYTLAVVDEGLLDLTHYHTPDPYEYFHAKEALFVNTFDIYGHIISDFKGNQKSFLSIGGDLSANAKSKVQRFKPMVRVAGPYFLKEGETQVRKIQLPNYIGSVRVMIVAGFDGAYGSEEFTKKVKSPLMVMTTLPRVLGPDESIQLPVSVFVEKAGMPVKVKIKSNEHLIFSGITEQEFTPTKTGDYQMYFPAKVISAIGAVKVTVEATQGKQRAYENLEVPVRLANTRQTKVSEAFVKSSAQGKVDYSLVGLKGTNRVTAEISVLPPMDLEKRLRYLIEYPYGCVEQTTSSVFPQLVLSDLTEVSMAEKKLMERNIKAGIKKLQHFQISSGALAYWPGAQSANEWGTNYAGHFLVKAASKGYVVSSQFLNAWREFQSNTAQTWTKGQDMEAQAYRLYLLAMEGHPEFSAMNRLKESISQNDEGIVSWYLAGAYALAGQKNIAQQIVAKLSTVISPYRDFSGNFGSDIRDRAIMIEISTLLGKEEQAYKMIEEFCKVFRSERWLSTQETAYGLIAVSEYAKGRFNSDVYAEVKIPDKGWQKIKLNAPVYSLTLSSDVNSKGALELRNLSSKSLNVRVISSGIPAQGLEQTMFSGLSMSVLYYNNNGDLLDFTNLKKGTDFYAEITVIKNSPYDRIDEIALAYRIPSGWQIQNPRMKTSSENVETATVDYTDIRDDAVNYFFDMEENNGAKKVFRVALNASFAGKYYLPGTTVAAMYDNKMSASLKGKWVVVRE